jgi:hypothetical protein
MACPFKPLKNDKFPSAFHPNLQETWKILPFHGQNCWPPQCHPQGHLGASAFQPPCGSFWDLPQSFKALPRAPAQAAPALKTPKLLELRNFAAGVQRHVGGGDGVKHGDGGILRLKGWGREG